MVQQHADDVAILITWSHTLAIEASCQHQRRHVCLARRPAAACSATAKRVGTTACAAALRRTGLSRGPFVGELELQLLELEQPIHHSVVAVASRLKQCQLAEAADKCDRCQLRAVSQASPAECNVEHYIQQACADLSGALGLAALRSSMSVTQRKLPYMQLLTKMSCDDWHEQHASSSTRYSCMFCVLHITRVIALACCSVA